MANKFRGWLLDVYADRRDGAVVWLIGEDGQRHHFIQDFPVSFYAAGPNETLRELWIYLQKLKIHLKLSRTSRKELFEGSIDVLEIQVLNPAVQPGLFKKIHERFPALDYYDANIPFAIRYHAAHDIFPLAQCIAEVEQGRIVNIESVDTRWAIHPSLPPLRILSIQPNTNPGQFKPQFIEVQSHTHRESIATENPVTLLKRLSQLIDEADPDVIATQYGDKWLFPFLFQIAEKFHLSFNPNRDKRKRPIQIKESTFTSYGRVVHRDQQTLLLGRIHVDGRNSMLFKDHGLFGFCQQARITGMPLQKAARRSPGGGFTAMQIRIALENKILIPVNKKQREQYKTVSQLLTADRGGVIYQPTIGLHRDVAEIDFFSMYPSMMNKWNISAETVRRQNESSFQVPGINQFIAQDNKGIVPSILAPLLEARQQALEVKAKTQDAETLARMETISDTLKGLGWVSYGYQGFSGNRIGSIEAHEAINAMSRELILRAKEVAEEAGFSILHLYVDSLFIRKEGVNSPDNYQQLILEMEKRTEIPLKLEGIFRWIAFLPSKQSGEIPVPNCFFGVFQNGKVKCRGIMARREDTPQFIKETQMRVIQLLAQEKDFDQLTLHLPKAIRYLRERYKQMVHGQTPSQALTLSRTLSKDLVNYRVPSAPARAAAQLVNAGKRLGAGQAIEYLHVRGQPDVLPWDLTENKKIELDYEVYKKLFFRAAEEILIPFGIEHRELVSWLDDEAGYFLPEDFAASGKKGLPLFELGRRRGKKRRELKNLADYWGGSKDAAINSSPEPEDQITTE